MAARTYGAAMYQYNGIGPEVTMGRRQKDCCITGCISEGVRIDCEDTLYCEEHWPDAHVVTDFELCALACTDIGLDENSAPPVQHPVR